MTHQADEIEAARPPGHTITTQPIGVNRETDGENNHTGWLYITDQGWIVYADISREKSDNYFIPNAAASETRVSPSLDAARSTVTFERDHFKLTVTCNTSQFEEFKQSLDSLRPNNS